MNNKGFTLVEAIAAMIILSIVMVAGFSVLSGSAIRSEVTKQRIDDSTVSRGVANYISSFTYDDIDANLGGLYAHVDNNNCTVYFSNACTQILSPVLNNYSYTSSDLFLIIFRPTVNASTLKNSNPLYTSVVDTEIDKFSFNSNQGNVIYYIVVNKGNDNNKFIQRGILTEEDEEYAD